MPGARGNTAGWGVLRATSGGPVLYSLRDLFATDRAAGAVNGTAAEPGPGARTVVDTENKLSISGGLLTFAGGKAAPAAGDPGIWFDALPRVVGRAFLTSSLYNTVAGKIFYFGWDSDVTSSPIQTFMATGGNFVYNDGGLQTILTAFEQVPYALAMIRRTNGHWLLMKGGAYPNWTLMWVGTTGNYAAMRPSISAYNGVFTVEDARVTDLPAPWNSDFGIATQQLAGARSAEDTFAHAADCLIGFTVTTLPTVGEIDVTFRRQDANNQWYIAVKADGSLVLREYVNGTPTVRLGTSAGEIQNGHRIVAVADGATIRLFSNSVAKGTYSAAENFKTLTAGSIPTLGTGGAVSDLVSWPRRISGAALAALNKV